MAGLTAEQDPSLWRVAFDLVAVRFYMFKDKTFPDAKHRVLPLPDPSSEHVVILIDGIGSSSAEPFVGELGDWLEEAGFAVCVYSYQGIRSRRYDPRDTVLTPFDQLVDQLDEYVAHYAAAKCIVLVGYSFGGLIIGEWLYRHRNEIRRRRANVSAVAGSCLVVTPIRLRSTMIFYQAEETRKRAGARGEIARGMIAAMVKGYTADPELLPVIAPLVLIRCKVDGLLDDRLYTYQDRETDDQVPEVEIEEADHASIRDEVWLREPLVEAVRALCERHIEMTS